MLWKPAEEEEQEGGFENFLILAQLLGQMQQNLPE